MSGVKLLPCPFCGGDAQIVRRDVEPQQDPYYSRKVERFPECRECGAVLFDRAWHEGFVDDEQAVGAWNSRGESALAAAARAFIAPYAHLSDEMLNEFAAEPHVARAVLTFRAALGESQ